MLPPNIKAIVNQVEKAIEKANTAADKRSESANEQQKAVAYAIASAETGFADKFEAYEKKQASADARKESREQKTLCALWAAAGLTLLLAGLAACQLREMRRAYEPLKEAATAAANSAASARADQRAWIGAPEINMVDSKIDLATVDIVLIFKNLGRTPTNGLHIDADIIPAAAWRDGVTTLCEKGSASVRNNPPSFYEFSSVPGGAFPITRVPSKDFTGIRRASLKAIEYPHIVGCVIYGQHAEPTRHKTGFVASIRVIDDDITVTNVYAIEPN